MTPDQAGGAPPGTAGVSPASQQERAGETPAVRDDAATGRLAENILYFARALRAAGIPLGPGSVLDALAAVRAAGVGGKEDLFKSPGVAETLDWASALSELDVVALDPATVSDTLGVLLKYQDDIARIEGTKAKELLDEVRATLRAAE